MTETALAELLAADLSGLDLVALIIDGVYFAESCCLVATGIGIDGVKHPLALVQGSAENATLVTELLVDLRQRGLDVTRPMLVGLDGSKALRNAVLDVLDHPVIQRCQLHKIRNVKTICHNDFGQVSAAGWPMPTTPPQRWRPKPRCCPWPKSLTARTPRRQPACVRACTRPSRCCGWMLRPPGQRSPAPAVTSGRP
jgi:hypothetical protein